MWRTFCENVGRQGRTAALFIFAVLGFVVTIALVSELMGVLRHQDVDPWTRFYVILILSVVSSVFLFWLGVRVRRSLRERHRAGTNGAAREPLAYEEYRRARSKLLRPHQNKTK
jgi:Na+/melibiose symporter-like transporter